MVYEPQVPKRWPGWTEADQARVNVLAAKKQLAPYERGELAALRQRADEAQRQQVAQILARGDRR